MLKSKVWLGLVVAAVMIPAATTTALRSSGNSLPERIQLEQETAVDYVDLYAQTVRSTVVVLNYGLTASRYQGMGSGVVYRRDLSGYYLITNHHVVDGGESFSVILSSGQRVSATLLGADSNQDVAVLRVSPLLDLEVATIDLTAELQPGDAIFTIGTPGELDFAFTMTRGIVAGVNRVVDLDATTSLDAQTHAIQIDAAVNPGNSGGPMFDQHGNLVGINSLKLTNDGLRSVQGLNFALPIHDMVLAAEQIRTSYQSFARLGRFRRSTLGNHVYASVMELSFHERYALGLPTTVIQGVIIKELASTGPNAFLNKVVPVWSILTHWNGVPVVDKVQLRQMLYDAAPQSQVEVTLLIPTESGYTTSVVTITIAQDA